MQIKTFWGSAVSPETYHPYLGRLLEFFDKNTKFLKDWWNLIQFAGDFNFNMYNSPFDFVWFFVLLIYYSVIFHISCFLNDMTQSSLLTGLQSEYSLFLFLSSFHSSKLAQENRIGS